MFQFTSSRFSYTILFIYGQYTSQMYWVSPFRYLWVNRYLLLTTAFRSLSRLSSPLDAQAFTLRSYQLNLIFSYFRKSRIFCTNFCLLLLYYIFFNVLKCANNYQYNCSGGDKESRTLDLLLARQALQPTELCPHSAHSKINNTSQTFLLRKEVIQPHLPIRLPCYDFTPIIKPTFGHFDMDFGYSQLSWCDGRCVQGPGTYSPQYADL